jgi:hypothetical protein
VASRRVVGGDGRCPSGVIFVDSAMSVKGPLYLQLRSNHASPRIDEMCHNVWPGRALQDGVPRAANVRAASMY